MNNPGDMLGQTVHGDGVNIFVEEDEELVDYLQFPSRFDVSWDWLYELKDKLLTERTVKSIDLVSNPLLVRLCDQ